MTYTAEQPVESLLAEPDHAPTAPLNETQTCRSEILEEILRLVAVSIETRERAENIAKLGRWV